MSELMDHQALIDAAGAYDKAPFPTISDSIIAHIEECLPMQPIQWFYNNEQKPTQLCILCYGSNFSQEDLVRITESYYGFPAGELWCSWAISLCYAWAYQYQSRGLIYRGQSKDYPEDKDWKRIEALEVMLWFDLDQVNTPEHYSRQMNGRS